MSGTSAKPPAPATPEQKPGERVLPARTGATKQQPETVKKPGLGGAPSPVGENDLA